MHKTLASFRIAQADMETFSLETHDQGAKQLFADTSEQLGQIINTVPGRVNYIEDQEPQFKMNPREQATTK